MSPSVSTSLPARRRAWVVAYRATLFCTRHWLFAFNLLWGVFISLPWLAPVFMQVGHNGPARIIYLAYATQCHQLPQRSFFLFGPKTTYSLAEVQAAWHNTNNPIILRQFIGNSQMGWKVAWSDRMVSMWVSLFAASLAYARLHRRLQPLPLWNFALFCLPLAIDGGTHLLSDLVGIGNGFRDSNTWLAALTNNVFLPAFYAGDTLGSFNSWIRLITGALFGVGLVWLAYPYLQSWFAETQPTLEIRLAEARS